MPANAASELGSHGHSMDRLAVSTASMTMLQHLVCIGTVNPYGVSCGPNLALNPILTAQPDFPPYMPTECIDHLQTCNAATFFGVHVCAANDSQDLNANTSSLCTRHECLHVSAYRSVQIKT